MTDKILNELLLIFNASATPFLNIEDIALCMKKRGFYKNIKTHKAKEDIWNYLCTHPQFLDVERNGKIVWVLHRWLPPNKKTTKNNNQLKPIEPLHLGLEISHILSASENEIHNGAFPIRGQKLDRFRASMDENQRNHSNVDVLYYGSENIVCNITQDSNENWNLESEDLQRLYSENGVQAGDTIFLVVEGINPLALRLYTEWDRDLDTYRRYEQRRKIELTPSTDLHIRDLIYIYLKRCQEIKHRSDIVKTVLDERQEVSEKSIDVCLGKYSHLFVPIEFQRGYWGLREWNHISVAKRPQGSNPEKDFDNADLPCSIESIDYILANIAAEDLVCKILRANTSLSASEITRKIAKYYYVDENILKRTSFLNISDSRIIRLRDGTFTLDKNLEETIDGLAAKERKLNEQIYDLENKIESVIAQYKEKFIQLEEERDGLRKLTQEWIEQHEETTRLWEERTQMLSEFLIESMPHIGQDNLNHIFERLRRKAESSPKRET